MKSVPRIIAATFAALVLSTLAGCIGLEYIPSLIATVPIATTAAPPPTSDPSSTGIGALIDAAAGYLAKTFNNNQSDTAPAPAESAVVVWSQHCKSSLATVAFVTDSGTGFHAHRGHDQEVATAVSDLATQSGCFQLVSAANADYVATVKANTMISGLAASMKVVATREKQQFEVSTTGNKDTAARKLLDMFADRIFSSGK